MRLFRRSISTSVDDSEQRAKARAETEARQAAAEQISAEIIPVSDKLAGYLEHNHFADKIRSAYRLREGS